MDRSHCRCSPGSFLEDRQEERKVLVEEQEVAHVESIETEENVPTRTFGAHLVVSMEVRKVVGEAQGRA